MGISVWQILIIGIILVLLFGRGKISELMGDVARASVLQEGHGRGRRGEG